VKVPVWDALAGLAGPHPLPPLFSVVRSWGGGRGGELLMGHVLPGNSELGGYSDDLNGRTKVAFHSGVSTWRLKWADQSGVSFWRLKMATQMGGPKWRFILGEPIWQVLLAGFDKR
jgi:hypothetical protein